VVVLHPVPLKKSSVATSLTIDLGHKLFAAQKVGTELGWAGNKSFCKGME
jgi:hypothetical protein